MYSLKVQLSSYQGEKLNQYIKYLREYLGTTAEVKYVSFPIKNKKFCILTSPHTNKDAREHFEISIHKKVVWISPLNNTVFDMLLKSTLPPYILCKIKD
jgi:small subunit ribosomal protein S10